jgi:hypothetical protein
VSVGLYWDVDVSPEEEDELLKKIADKMHDLGMELPATVILETIEPLSYFGSQMGRFLLSPFMPFFGEELGLTGAKLIQIFEKRQNVEKIIQYIDEKSRKKKEEKKSVKKAKPKEKSLRTGWRRFLP